MIAKVSPRDSSSGGAVVPIYSSERAIHVTCPFPLASITFLVNDHVSILVLVLFSLVHLDGDTKPAVKTEHQPNIGPLYENSLRILWLLLRFAQSHTLISAVLLPCCANPEPIFASSTRLHSFLFSCNSRLLGLPSVLRWCQTSSEFLQHYNLARYTQQLDELCEGACAGKRNFTVEG